MSLNLRVWVLVVSLGVVHAQSTWPGMGMMRGSRPSAPAFPPGITQQSLHSRPWNDDIYTSARNEASAHHSARQARLRGMLGEQMLIQTPDEKTQQASVANSNAVAQEDYSVQRGNVDSVDSDSNAGMFARLSGSAATQDIQKPALNENVQDQEQTQPQIKQSLSQAPPATQPVPQFYGMTFPPQYPQIQMPMGQALVPQPFPPQPYMFPSAQPNGAMLQPNIFPTQPAAVLPTQSLLSSEASSIPSIPSMSPITPAPFPMVPPMMAHPAVPLAAPPAASSAGLPPAFPPPPAPHSGFPLLHPFASAPEPASQNFGALPLYPSRVGSAMVVEQRGGVF